MEAQLTAQDLDSLLNEVARFASRSIAPQFARHEEVASFETLTKLLAEATESGLVNSVENTGVSIWEDGNDPLLLQFSCRALSLIAWQNPGLAYLFHHSSLTHYVLKQLDITLDPKAIPLIALQGHYGLARQTLARYVKAPLAQADIEFLQDYFRPSGASCAVFSGRPDWTHLLTPEMTGNGLIQFAVIDRKQLECTTLESGLGLNELSSFCWRVSKKTKVDKISSLSLAESRALLSQALQMQWLGLLSIGTGTTERGYQLAKDYAALRVQGGKVTAQHPAVQQLLAQPKSALTCSQRLIANLCAQPLTLSTLGELAQVRAQLQPSLCQAANSLLQVFGGMGYMQDTGLEKVVRDNLQLKLLTGTLIELQLFSAELEYLT